MKLLPATLAACLALGLSSTALAGNSALQNCKDAWDQSSAKESCVGGQTVITASGDHCNIEAICLNACTWQTLTDRNYITVQQMKDLQNCNGQLNYNAAQCKIWNEGGCDD